MQAVPSYSFTKEKGVCLEGYSTSITNLLTVKPIEHPNYKKDEKVEPSFPVFQEIYNDDGTTICVPKFWANEYLEINEKIPLTGKSTDIQFHGTLREAQTKVLEMVLPTIHEKGGGILSLPCGHGKTCVAIYTAALLKVPTLVLVHKQFLMNQWVESIQKFTNASVGTIQRDKVDIEGKDIVIAMLQSVSMKDYPPGTFSGFDFLVVDEVHNVATKVFSRALAKIHTTYTLGLSATPDRDDGLSKVFMWYLGPMIHRAQKDKNKNVTVKLLSFQLDPQTADPRDARKYREIKNFRGELNLAKMLSNLGELRPRNELIIKTLASILEKEPSRCCLILSNRIGQLETLLKMFTQVNPTTPCSLYIGRMKAPQLKEAESCQVLFATYEMVNEGFDLPKLNTLLFATPRSKIEQAVGRILRKKSDEHPPVVVDVLDDSIPVFKGQGYKRKYFYKSLSYKTMYCN